MTSGIEPATFRLLPQCLYQLRHRLPPAYVKAAVEFGFHSCTSYSRYSSDSTVARLWNGRLTVLNSIVSRGRGFCSLEL